MFIIYMTVKTELTCQSATGYRKVYLGHAVFHWTTALPSPGLPGGLCYLARISVGSPLYTPPLFVVLGNRPSILTIHTQKPTSQMIYFDKDVVLFSVHRMLILMTVYLTKSQTSHTAVLLNILFRNMN